MTEVHARMQGPLWAMLLFAALSTTLVISSAFWPMFDLFRLVFLSCWLYFHTQAARQILDLIERLLTPDCSRTLTATEIDDLMTAD